MNEQIKYPWLKARHWETNKRISDTNALNNMPEGWKRAFGDILCEELDKAIREDGVLEEFTILQLKEKYGELRIYCAPMTDKVAEVVRAFEIISRHVCINCGRPDTPMLMTTWEEPVCKECYAKSSIASKTPYETIASPRDKIPDTIRWATWSKETGDVAHEQNIKEFANKIRKKWRDGESAT